MSSLYWLDITYCFRQSCKLINKQQIFQRTLNNRHSRAGRPRPTGAGLSPRPAPPHGSSHPQIKFNFYSIVSQAVKNVKPYFPQLSIFFSLNPSQPVKIFIDTLCQTMYFILVNNDKINNFRRIIRHHKYALLAAQIPYSTVYSWEKTDRLPSERNAKKIAAILSLSLSDVPYYRTEHVI